MTPQEKAIHLINKFTYWNTSQAEREGILSALNVVSEILEIIEFQKKIFKFDNVICHLWNKEFEKVKHLKIPEYVTILHDEDSMPFNDKLLTSNLSTSTVIELQNILPSEFNSCKKKIFSFLN